MCHRKTTVKCQYLGIWAAILNWPHSLSPGSICAFISCLSKDAVEERKKEKKKNQEPVLFFFGNPSRQPRASSHTAAIFCFCNEQKKDKNKGRRSESTYSPTELPSYYLIPNTPQILEEKNNFRNSKEGKKQQMQ